MSLLTLALVATGVAGVACGPSSAPSTVVIPPPAPNDAGPGSTPDPSPNPPSHTDGGPNAHDLSKLTVVGKVSASGINIVARCGSKPPVHTQSDVDGRYSITADVAGCNPLVIEYTQTTFIPNLRVIQLPPVASPLVLDVTLSPAKTVECGSQICKTEDGEFSVPAALVTPVTQGRYAGVSGMQAADALPGEQKDTTGQPIILFGFDYTEFFDTDGHPVDHFQNPVPFVIPLRSEAERRNVGDVRRETTDSIEMDWYVPEKSTGRWAKTNEPALVYYQWPCSLEDHPPTPPLRPVTLKHADGSSEIFSAAIPAELKDIHTNTLTVDCGSAPPNDRKPATQFAVVGLHGESGFHAWGISAPHKACFVVNVKDACGAPVAGATLVARGVEQPTRAESFSTKDGVACIEVMTSEPACADGGIETHPELCDYNYNGYGGQPFFMNLELSHPTLAPSRQFDTQELPRAESSCAKPEKCLPLKHSFEVDCPVAQ